jgi:glycosyltransferase involved in cell wall biosynthesis
VRDGRDAVVSAAWHRCNIVAPGSDFLQNLEEAIRAQAGSFFGGWSENALRWTERADVILRFEDLVREPILTTEKLRHVVDLPRPDLSKVPTFESQKAGSPQYGSGKNVPPGTIVGDYASKNFHRGQVGAWKADMPADLLGLFWQKHGEMMERLGYGYDGAVTAPHADLDPQLYDRMYIGQRSRKRRRVLIEGSKLVLHMHDGVKRYVMGLLEGLRPLAEDPTSRWQVDLFIDGDTVPLQDYFRGNKTPVAPEPSEVVGEQPVPRKGLLLGYERGLLGFKGRIRKIVPPGAYRALSKVYRWLPVRPALKLVRGTVQSGRALSRRLKERTTPYRQYDVIHLPLQQHFELFAHTRRPVVTTVHDLSYRYFPDYHEERNVELCEKGMRFALKRNRHLIAVSRATERDVAAHYKVKPWRMHVTHEATDRNIFQPPQREKYIRLVRQRYGIPPGIPYVLCLSTIEPRKNLDNVVAAFSSLVASHPQEDLHLVIAGRFGWKTEHLSDLKLPRVVFTGFVEDEHLSVIYSQALALCYVSFYEGFGLPPLEAMSCRTPVIYGNNSSMPEVVGEGGLPADPSDVDDIRNKIETIFRDKALRDRLALAAWLRSYRFSWRRMAAETLNVYEKAIGK